MMAMEVVILTKKMPIRNVGSFSRWLALSSSKNIDTQRYDPNSFRIISWDLWKWKKAFGELLFFLLQISGQKMKAKFSVLHFFFKNWMWLARTPPCPTSRRRGASLPSSFRWVSFISPPSTSSTVDGDSNVLREQKYCYISNSQTYFVVCPAPPPQNRWRFVKIWNLDFRSHFKQNIHHGQKNNVWFWFLKSMASKYVFLEGIHVSLMMCSFI